MRGWGFLERLVYGGWSCRLTSLILLFSRLNQNIRTPAAAVVVVEIFVRCPPFEQELRDSQEELESLRSEMEALRKRAEEEQDGAAIGSLRAQVRAVRAVTRT